MERLNEEIARSFDLGTGDKTVKVLVIDDDSEITAKTVSLLSKEHGMDVIVVGAGSSNAIASMVAQDFAAIEARMAASFGVSPHMLGNRQSNSAPAIQARMADAFRQLGMSASAARESIDGFKRLINAPIGLKPPMSFLDTSYEEPNHPYGWYRKFEKPKGKRNLK